MTKNIIESWITTVCGTCMIGFGGLTMWFEKTPLWGSILIWIIGGIFIFANEKKITGLFDKIPKLK